MRPLTEADLHLLLFDVALEHKRPRSTTWKYKGNIVHAVKDDPSRRRETGQHAYLRRGLLAISEYTPRLQLPGQPEGFVGPTWVLSISYRNRRASDRQVQLALRAFDMVDAEEDNHGPGISRTFFLPVDPAVRGVCECKTTEDVIVEPDGYTWTNPTKESGEACRGCRYEKLFGHRCSIHHPELASSSTSDPSWRPR